MHLADLSQAVITLATVAISGGVGFLVRQASAMVTSLNKLSEEMAAHLAADKVTHDSQHQRITRLEDARKR